MSQNTDGSIGGNGFVVSEQTWATGVSSGVFDPPRCDFCGDEVDTMIRPGEWSRCVFVEGKPMHMHCFVVSGRIAALEQRIAALEAAAKPE